MSMFVQDFSLRGACDRCHGQKLRCRPGNNDGCMRCERAGVRCIPRAQTRFTRPSRNKRARPQAPVSNEHSQTQNTENGALEQFTRALSDHGELLISPTSLPQGPYDLSTNHDFASLESDFVHSMDPNLEQPTLAHEHVQLSGQAFAQDMSGQDSGVEQGEHETEKQTSTAPRHRHSLFGTVGLSQAGKAHQMDVDHRQGGNTLSSGSGYGGPDVGFGRWPSGPQHKNGESSACRDTGPRTAQPAVDNIRNSWIRRLSDVNVEIHQHTRLIPPLGIWQDTWTNATMGERPSLAQPDLSLGLDDTLRLSNDYLKNLTDAVSEIQISQTHNASTTPGAIPAPEPEQHSQLLILSTYVCLIELYNKTLQHVKACTEARLNTDPTAPNKSFPTQLPSVTIGSYHLPASSPMQTLVMVGTIEGTLAKISDLVDEIMRPARSPHEPTDTPGAAIYEEGTSPPSVPSSVAQASLQALRGQEDAIMALVQEVWALAVRCRAS